MQRKRILILVVLALVIAAWFSFDLGSYLQLGVLKQRIDDLRQ